MGIYQNLHEIRKEELEVANKELESKMDSVERSCYNQDLSCLTSFGYLVPALDSLLQLAEDSLRHFQILYSRLRFAILELDYENEKSVRNLKEALTPDIQSVHIKEVLQLTYYLMEDT